jgi:hypothetical protein
VATELNQWRRESKFFDALREENRLLVLETESLRSEIDLADSALSTYEIELFSAQNAIIRKDSINRVIMKNISGIHQIATDALKPKRWYQTNGFWFGAGGFFGTLSVLLTIIIVR